MATSTAHPDKHWRPIKGTPQPMPGKCGAPLTKNKPGFFCADWRMKGRRHCRRHGGKVKVGKENNRYIHGRRSRYEMALGTDLVASFRAASEDPLLLDLRKDLALLDLQIEMTLTEVLAPDISVAALASGRALMIEQLDLRRRLVLAETRRTRDLGQYITVAQALSFVTAVRELIDASVTNALERGRFHDGLRRLLGPRIGSADDAPVVVGQ